ncbi:MAG TPA: segregation/condensation protein A [Candidatus Limiplasma sp.]|nr:segregation/condensation protein A [Candidatus Limiplasma sp.]
MAIHIQLKQFDGPLDLLLHLIGKAKIDIKDIFVSEITEQFIEAVGNATDFDMDEASEFITMAALLVEIKSRSLLPKPRKEEEEDPEQLLIERLTAYKQLKESAVSMAEFEKSALQVFGKLPEEVPLPPQSFEIEGLTLNMLWDALLRIAQRETEKEPQDEGPVLREVRRDSYTVETCIQSIKDHLKSGPVTFDALFGPRPSRQEAVTLFIALLELLKRGKAHVSQAGTFDQIMLYPGRRKKLADA